MLDRPAVARFQHRLEQIDAVPSAIAAFVAVVALVAVGYALVTAVRRRRRDLAILKTLGIPSLQET